MYIIKSIEQTCTMCPSQWEGKTKCGRLYYIRFRHGQLTVEITTKPTDSDVLDEKFWDHCEMILQKSISYSDGYLSNTQMIKETKPVFKFPVKMVWAAKSHDERKGI